MTDKQKKIYTYILSFHKKHGYVPDTVTTARHFGVSKQAIHEQYKNLIHQGKLRKIDNVTHYELSTVDTLTV